MTLADINRLGRAAVIAEFERRRGIVLYALMAMIEKRFTGWAFRGRSNA